MASSKLTVVSVWFVATRYSLPPKSKKATPGPPNSLTARFSAVVILTGPTKICGELMLAAGAAWNKGDLDMDNEHDEHIVGIYEVLDALEEALKASDPAKREALAEAIDGYHENFPEDFHWAVGA